MYMKKEKLESKKLAEDLVEVLKQDNVKITNLRLISLGNSIASGYSMVRSTKPLLLRNESLEEVLKEENINFERHHFARAQNNNDEHIFGWLVSNIKESEIHRMNRSDYSGSASSMITRGLTKEQIEEYYPLDMEKDFGLDDLIKDRRLNIANIVIYNGCTGSFLDAATRNGNLTQQLMAGVNRDTTSFEAVLKYIQEQNRQYNSNTQVYVCGAPNFLGLRVSELINNKIKKISKNYANVSYVEPVKSKFFYKPLETAEFTEETELTKLQQFFKKHGRQVDIHSDEEEYIEFNNNIMKTIKENYLIVNSLINIDRDMYKLNSTLEIENPEFIAANEVVQEVVADIFTKEIAKMPSPSLANQLTQRAGKYLTSRSPYDYFYIGKKRINNSIQKVKTK